MKEKKIWKKWTQEDIDFINNNQNKISMEEMAKQLNRSIDSIVNKLRRIPGSKYKYRPWTKEEVNYLEKYYDYSKIKEISEKLKRTENSIWLKVVKSKREKNKKSNIA